MNTDTQNPTPQTPTPSPEPPVASAYRAKGKIASLPKDQRELINHLLLDGATYAAVCQQMTEHGVSLNAENLSNWHNGGGYQDWLYQQQWREDTQTLQESAIDLAGNFDHPRFNQAALQLATLQIFAALHHLRSGSLDAKLGGDSAAFARLVNTLSRATRETLNAQKYLDACARARAALTELKDPNRKLTESETRAIVLKVDDILGLRSDAPDDCAPQPQAPSPSPATPPNPAAPTPR